MDKIEARPKNFRPMKKASTHGRITGPCGDRVDVWLRIDNDVIREATFLSNGCGHSIYCCSTAAYLVENWTVTSALEVSQSDVLAETGPVPEDHQHCALLAANTIKLAIQNYIQKQNKPTLGARFKQLFRT